MNNKNAVITAIEYAIQFNDAHIDPNIRKRLAAALPVAIEMLQVCEDAEDLIKCNCCGNDQCEGTCTHAMAKRCMEAKG